MRRTFFMTIAAIITMAILLSSLLSLPVPGISIAVAEEEGGPLPPASPRVLERPEDAGLRIALSWDVREGDFGYQVYRSESPDGPFEQIGGKAADSMSDYPVFLDDTATPGVTYYYEVSAVDEEWLEGPRSTPVSASLAEVFNAAAGSKSIMVSIGDQKVYFFEGGQLVNIMRCSTGLTGNTPTGNFHIISHTRLNAGCDYWMSFTGAHGMHGWPRYIPGYEEGLGAPASHGCIRLHPLECYWPYFWTPNGTPLYITWASLARRVVNGCHSTIGATQPSTGWYFAEGFTAGNFETWLMLANPGDAAAAVHVEFLKEGGEVVEADYPIAPRSRFTLAVDGVPGLEEAAFSIQVGSSTPIVAERAMYFTYNGLSDGSVTMGATQLSTDWYFAEGFNADTFDTYLLLANPGAEMVTAHVDFLLEGGTTVEAEYPIAPHSRFSLQTYMVPGLDHAAFSTHVSATGPVVAERAMYFRKGYTDGGHVAMGATEPSETWYFAEGCTREWYESYILIGNDQDQDALVDVDFFLPEGNIRYSFAVARHSRMTVPIQSLAYLDYAGHGLHHPLQRAGGGRAGPVLRPGQPQGRAGDHGVAAIFQRVVLRGGLHRGGLRHLAAHLQPRSFTGRDGRHLRQG